MTGRRRPVRRHGQAQGRQRGRIHEDFTATMWALSATISVCFIGFLAGALLYLVVLDHQQGRAVRQQAHGVGIDPAADQAQVKVQTSRRR